MLWGRRISRAEPKSRSTQVVIGSDTLRRQDPLPLRASQACAILIEVSASEAATRWTGWDPARGISAATASGSLLSSDAAGDLMQFELLALAGRGFRPPAFLTVRDLSSRPDESAGRGEPDRELLRQAWSMEYRQIAETASRAATPFAIYLLGVDPPAEATGSDLEVFNEFYTNVHLREVAERRKAIRATRLELVRLILTPPRGAPRYLAVYEVDESGASQRRHRGPPYSRGPEVWQAHTTPWRLWFRSLSA